MTLQATKIQGWKKAFIYVIILLISVYLNMKVLSWKYYRRLDVIRSQSQINEWRKNYKLGNKSYYRSSIQGEPDANLRVVNPDPEEQRMSAAYSATSTGADSEESTNHDASDAYSSAMPWLNRSEGVHETYLLSAFWDDRYSSASRPFISVLVFMKTVKILAPDGQIYCFVECSGFGGASILRVLAANMTEIRLRSKYRGKEFDGDVYLRFVVACHPEGCPRPERLSIGYRYDGITALDDRNSVPVEYPTKDTRHQFGICVPPIFGCLQPREVVEWFEMNRILGVTKVVIHNNSQCEETSKVFREYARQGFVELRQDHTVLPCDDNKTFGGWQMPMWRTELFIRDPLMLTDCMYRHMYDFKHTLFLDFDEILVPQMTRSLSEMIDVIESVYQTDDQPYNQLTFKSYFFLLDDLLIPKPADDSLPGFTSYLRHRKRLGPSPDNRRRKSVVSGTGCEFVNNHVCHVPITELKLEAPPQRQIYVSEEIAKIHHYRSTPCVKRSRTLIRCQGKVDSNRIFSDDAMLRYKAELIRNTRRQLKTLGLNMDA